MVRCTLEQRVFLYDASVKYVTDRKFQLNFRRNVRDDGAPSRQTIHNLMNKLRTGLLTDNKQKNKRQVLTAKLDGIGARFEHTPRKSPKRLAQKTEVCKCSARKATQMLKLRPYKTTAIHARLAAAQLVSTVCRRR
jgi:hypothetical protein